MKIIYVLTLKLHVKSNLKIKMSSEDRSVSVSVESTEDEFGDDMETENTVNSGDGKTVIQHKPIKKPRKPKLPKDPQAPKKPLRYKGK